MPIEPIDPTLIKIPELDPLSPGPDELLGEGDDHMRVVKSAVQNTFPVIGTGSCTLKAPAINQTFETLRPSSGIIAWWAEDDITPLPEGWAPCDGQIHNGITTPIMDSVFFRHAIDGEVPGSTEGSNLFTGNVESHILTVEEMPSHKHDVTIGGGDSFREALKSGSSYDVGGAVPFVVGYKGGSLGHVHTLSYDNQPLYYTLQPITYVGIGGI